jgi:hypothetical protein
MQATFTLKLIFYGLIGFIPNNEQNPTALTVVLADAVGSQHVSDGCKIPEHYPALFVAASKCRQDRGRCQFSSFLDKKFGFPKEDLGVKGSWRIDGMKINFSLINSDGEPVDIAGKLNFVRNRRQAGSQIPSNKTEATDFSWVPKVDLGKKIDAKCLSGKTTCPVAARVEVNGAGDVTTCHLVETHKEKLVCAHKFEAFTSPAQNPGPFLPQAVADAVMVTMQLPKKKNYLDLSVLLTIQTFDQKEPTQISLSPGENSFVNVWIVNIPEYMDDGDAACHNADVDKHSELYFNLSERQNGRPFPIGGRPVPKRLSNLCISGQLVQPDEGANSCPLLKFYLDGGPVPGDKPACATRQFSQ